MEISLLVMEKKIFKGFLPYMGMASLYLKDFIKNLVQIGKEVLRKSGLNFCMYTTLGQGQEMTLTFNTHLPS